MTESANKKGNPYHDEEGKFTTKEGQGHASDTLPTEKIDNASSKKISLKSGVDLTKLKQEIAAKTNPLENDMVMPQTIQEAELQGNRIIGATNIVGYDDSTDPAVAFDFNNALKDVTKDFKEILVGTNLWVYGTKNKRNATPQDYRNLVQQTMANPKYQQKLKVIGANPLVAMSLIAELGAKVISFDQGFDSSTLQKGCGGSTGFIAGTDPISKKPAVMAASSVKFNTIYAKDKQRFDDYPNDAIQDGHFLPIGNKTGAYMVGVHELGHHVFEKLKTHFEQQDFDALDNLLTDGIGMAKCDFRLLQNKGEISGYATYSQHEHMAEAFANVYCMGDGATEHNKKLVKFLKGIYDKTYPAQ